MSTKQEKKQLIKNEYIKEKGGVAFIRENIVETCFRWFIHITRQIEASRRID
jgi:hypothetical protein